MIPVNTRLSTYVYFVLLIIFVSALTLVAYTGFFSRYLGDDYCSAEAFNENGLIGSAVNWYMTWEGRYTHTLIRGFIGFVGPRGVSFFPLFLLVLWILALTFLLTEIGKILRMRVIFPGSLVSASIIVFVSLDGVPLAVKIQAFYWAMGSTPYTLPIILIIFNMGLFLALARKNHLKNTPIQVLMTMGITFLASGLSEIAAIFQIAVFMLVLCLCLLFVPRAYRRTAIHLALLNLVCALIGFGFLLAAPGNKVRGASLSPNSLETTLRLAITHFREPILHNTLVYAKAHLLSVFVGAAMVPLLSSPTKILQFDIRNALIFTLLVMGVGLTLILSGLVPTAYMLSLPPEARGQIIPHTVIILAVFILGAGLGMAVLSVLSRRPKFTRRLFVHSWIYAPIFALLVIAVTFAPLRSLRRNLEVSQLFQLFAREWDARDAMIRDSVTAGLDEVTIEPMEINLADLGYLRIIGPDQSWLNQCVADYYGLEKVTCPECKPFSFLLPPDQS